MNLNMTYRKEDNMKIKNFKKEVEMLINKLGIDNYFNIPDFILADYLANQLEVLDVLKNKRDNLESQV